MNKFIKYPTKHGVMIPKCFYADDDVGVLIMEDLRLKGYSVGDKKIGEKIK